MSLCSSLYPKYKLIEDLVHYILSGCNVHNGLHGNDKFFEQVLMSLRAVANREANLHGVEGMPGLDLRRSQRHRHIVTNAVEGDLPNVDQDVLETSIDRGTLGIDSVYGRVRR